MKREDKGSEFYKQKNVEKKGLPFGSPFEIFISGII